ncbi:CvpA family protein [Helicobacter sp. MIT 05-5294]|uniref:CvpA family protein n=1 Tax=Helicobacter sp. MIT 05-5294 TaxID=1548150 RepID=UPI00051FC426|nr:CvpA family protein [Helicobacter sp. MIT 05-5294]TLD88583.1 CvpA family protein [Helicobacter sp. MIT 05-5294]
MEDFSWFDLVLGALILLLAIRGVINGFVREFFGFVGIVGGVYGASVYGSSVGEWISANIYTFKNPSAISLVGFLVLLAVIWGVALILAEIVQKLVHLSALGGLNRILGFCFGALKIFMIFAILLATLANIQFARSFIEKYTQGSYLYPMLLSTGTAVIKLDVVQNNTPEIENLQKNIF